MKTFHLEPKGLDSETRRFYAAFLRLLQEEKVPFLVRGAYAMASYTGIVRHTKDLDLFVTPEVAPRVLECARRAGYATEVTSPLWIAKVFSGDAFVDIIYRSGNSLTEVTDEWLEHATDAILLEVPVKLCAPEETLWSKAFIMEREHYDGADVAHYLLSWGPRMDWPRLLRHFGEHWRVLLSHLVLFGYIYPDDTEAIPDEVMQELVGRLVRERGVKPRSAERPKLCRGTFLSRAFRLVDVGLWGYEDPRFHQPGRFTPDLMTSWRCALDADRQSDLEKTGISVEDTSHRPVGY